MDQNNLPIVKRTFSNGVVMEDAIDEAIAPAGTVSLAINKHFDKIGVVKTRPGITQLGDSMTASHAIKGMWQFLDSGTGTNDRLVVVVNTVLYYLLAGVWTSKRTGLTADTKARFTSFVDFLWMVNNTEATAVWDGSASAFSTSGNALSAPIGKFIENFKNRVWIAHLGSTGFPSRITYSSVPDSSTQVVLWSGTDSSFIDVSPGDGEDITAIKRFSKILWVFKNNFMYPIYSINESEPDPRIFVGTYSQESVTVSKDGMYWHHPSGIYRLREGESSPKEISKPIYGIIKNVTLANYSETASWTDDDHVFTYLGNVTLDSGLTISNCVVRWTISTEVWTIYSYPVPFVAGAQYNDGSTISRVVGDNNGKVYTIDSGITDNGTPIFTHFETHYDSITPLRSDRKSISKMAALHENASGAKFGYRADTDSVNVIKPIGALSQKINTVFDGQNIRFHRVKFIVTESSIGAPSTFNGYEILNITNEGITKD